MIKASYETKFWDLFDSNMSVGTKLEEIIDDFGWGSRFFPNDGEPSADEQDYKDVLDEYENGSSGSSKYISVDTIINQLIDDLNAMNGIKRVEYADSIDAIRFTLQDGHKYQLVLQDIKGM